MEKLLSQYASQFIWLFYIPEDKFHISWHNCNHFEMTLETSCDELFVVQQCGLHVVGNKEREEIDKRIMESTVQLSIATKKRGLNDDISTGIRQKIRKI